VGDPRAPIKPSSAVLKLWALPLHRPLRERCKRCSRKRVTDASDATDAVNQKGPLFQQVTSGIASVMQPMQPMLVPHVKRCCIADFNTQRR
jgi:hypothetical protein